MKTPVLETDRLILRPACIDDAPSIQKYFNDWDIIKGLGPEVPWPYPEDGALSFLRDVVVPALDKGEQLIWAITVKNNGDEAVGLISFRPGDHPTGNRGFWIAKHLQGQGLMTEAVSAMQDYIFFELGIEKIEVFNALSNSGSKAVKEKTGAVYKGLKPSAYRTGDTESEVWEVTRKSWAKIRGYDF